MIIPKLSIILRIALANDKTVVAVPKLTSPHLISAIPVLKNENSPRIRATEPVITAAIPANLSRLLVYAPASISLRGFITSMHAFSTLPRA